MTDGIKTSLEAPMEPAKIDNLIMTGENLAEKNLKNIDTVLLELQNEVHKLRDTLVFKPMKWNCSKLSDWLDQLDVCYEVESINSGYNGNCKLITNDFHDAIIKIKNRMKKVFAGVDGKIDVDRGENKAYYAQAALGKSLVKYSMRLADIETKSSDCYYDLANYGFTIAYTPLKIVEQIHGELNDYILDKKTGQALFFNGEALRGEESWKEVVRYKVYTDFQEIDPRDIIFDPTIADIGMQSLLARKLRFTVPMLKELGNEGLFIGVEDFLNEEDMEGDWTESPTARNQDDKDTRPRVVTLIHCFKEDVTGKTKDIKRYEMILGNWNRVLYVKEFLFDSWPYVNAQIENSRRYPGLGIGPGQIIYPCYLGLNTRLQQGFDKRTMEIIPGGLYDSMLGSIKELGPNIWKGIPGLMTLPGKPVITNNELIGQTSQLDQIDLSYMQSRIQSMVPSLLGGTPTGTSADRTWRGMEMLVGQAQALIDTSLIDVGNKLYGGYAEKAYNNYVQLFKQITESRQEIHLILSDWLGKEKVEYTDIETGKTEIVEFPLELPPLRFGFTGANLLVNKAEFFEKMQLFTSFIKDWGTVVPDYVMQSLRALFFPAVLKDLFEALEFDDVKRYFPEINWQQIASDSQAQSQALMQELMTSKSLLRKVTQKIIELIYAGKQMPDETVKLVTEKLGLELQQYIEQEYEALKDQAANNQNK